MSIIQFIAYTSMVIDHIGKIFFPDVIFWQLIGRISLPMFCFCCATGMKKTHNAPRYICRIFILGIISQYPYYMLFGNVVLNICFTLSISLLSIFLIDNYRGMAVAEKFFSLMVLILLILMLLLEVCEYGIYVLFFCLVSYYYRLDGKICFVIMVGTLVINILYGWSYWQLFSLLSIPALMFFNNIKSIKIKLFAKYSIYPAHIILLLFFRWVI